MSFLEEQYLRRLSYRLRNYKEKGNHTFQFSCPICNDSDKKKSKARGYAFDKGGKLIIWCHNCNHEFKTLPRFLEHVDPLLYKEFIFARYKENNPEDIRKEVLPEMFKTKKYIPNIFETLPLVKTLESDNLAKVYIDTRKIPVDKYEIYYAEKFIEWTKGHTDKFLNWKTSDHSRIIIPFKARDGHYIGYTARSVNNQDQKYYRIFIDETEKEKFFGIDRVDESKTVYVLEGEIDSMFLDNAIAVSNGKLDTYLNKNAVYIPDSDKRNKHIVKGIEKLFDKGFKVCLLPDDLPGKDINDFIVAGLKSEKIIDIIKSSTYSGLVGKIQFNKWRKCE